MVKKKYPIGVELLWGYFYIRISSNDDLSIHPKIHTLHLKDF